MSKEMHSENTNVSQPLAVHCSHSLGAKCNKALYLKLTFEGAAALLCRAGAGGHSHTRGGSATAAAWAA
jgi:hypothetical protein